MIHDDGMNIFFLEELINEPPSLIPASTSSSPGIICNNQRFCSEQHTFFCVLKLTRKELCIVGAL